MKPIQIIARMQGDIIAKLELLANQLKDTYLSTQNPITDRLVVGDFTLPNDVVMTYAVGNNVTPAVANPDTVAVSLYISAADNTFIGNYLYVTDKNPAITNPPLGPGININLALALIRALDAAIAESASALPDALVFN